VREMDPGSSPGVTKSAVIPDLIRDPWLVREMDPGSSPGVTKFIGLPDLNLNLSSRT
jgi:hypothetical protein